MASKKLIATLVVATAAFCIELGALSAITNYSCVNDDAADYINLDTSVSKTLGEDSNDVTGRRLLGNPPSSEWKARCSFYFGLEWTCVFLLLAIVVAAWLGARPREGGAPLTHRLRLAAFSVLAMAWKGIILTWYSEQVATLANNLRDAEVKDADYKDALGEDKMNLFRAYQTYFAGMILAIISLCGYVYELSDLGEAPPAGVDAKPSDAAAQA